MTLDMHPEWWRRMVKLYRLWLNLSENDADRLIAVLSEADKERFDIFLRMVGTEPAEVMKELEADIDKGADIDDIRSYFIDKLPRPELRKLVKAGLKRGKLITNLSKMNVEELRELVWYCSLPKNLLAYLIFNDGLDAKRRDFLLG